jgi:protein tyrosine/serine phosphatase
VRPNGFIARIFEPEGDTGGVAPHVEAAVRGVANASEAADAMQAVYADMPCRPVIISAFRLYFSALAEADGPSLVHCTAGKDRTGIAAALLHRLMGVHHDDMFADYMLTNTAGKAEERLTYGVAMMRRNFGAELSDESARALVTVAPRYLEAAFAAIEARFGSIEAYLHDEIGIDPAMRQTLEKRLLV